jgi:hypothetical protein
MTQPTVTEANIRNEFEYWLAQMPPHKVLTIFGQKLFEISQRPLNKSRKQELQALCTAIEGLASLDFELWSRRQ